MSAIRLALYKGPRQEVLYRVTHWLIRLVVSIRGLRWCPYSHAELQIYGTCYSASTQDKGTRAKAIDIFSGRWDVFDIPDSDDLAEHALAVFESRKAHGYDWLGAARWALPFLPQSERKDYCFEIVANMLGIPEPENQSPLDICEIVQERYAATQVKSGN